MPTPPVLKISAVPTAAPSSDARAAAMAALKFDDTPGEEVAPADAPAADPVQTSAPLPEGEQPAPEEPPAEVVEPPAPVVPVETKPPLDLRSKQLAAIARQEKELRAKEAALNERIAKIDKLEKLMQDAPTNPLAYLEAAGLDFGKVQDFVVNGKAPTSETKLELQVKSMQAELEKFRAANEAKEKQLQQLAAQRAVAEYREKLGASAKAAADKFDLVLAEGDEGIDLAVEITERYYQETGQILPMNEALTAAEEHFEKRAERVLLTSKKVKAKLSPVAPKPAAPQAASESGPTRAAPTLTNAQAASGVPPRAKIQTDDEVRRAAMAALRFDGE
jgi:hypothetical protein